MIRAKKCARTVSSRSRRRFRCTSHTRIVPGSGARMRTPMACCASFSPRGRGSISSRDNTSSRCRRCSTTGPAKSWAGIAQPMRFANCCARTLNAHRPFLCSRRILMGAFNELKADALCPRCGKLATFIVQFKYGNTSQFHYHVAESLKWGGNDIGRKEAKRVVVEGIGGPCPNCGVEFIDFNILVEENRIVTFRPIGTKRVSSSPEGFIVLDE